MACFPTAVDYGYEDRRFENDVDEDLHCSICYNVLKEPRMCRNNEHIFCLCCITEHLKVNRQNCPECNEHLTVDTLRRPRVVNKLLSKLKINCDYSSRGCPEFICIEDLKTHVQSCGFAPVLCSNENCGMEINKKERVRHETEICEYREVECHDCRQTQEVVERLLNEQFDKLNGNLEELNNDMQINYIKIKCFVGGFERSLVGMNEKIDKKMDAIKEHIKNSEDEMKWDQQEVREEVREVARQVNDVRENISQVNNNLDEVKTMMAQMFGKLNQIEMLNKLPSPNREMFHSSRKDILIAGGYNLEQETAEKSSEIYSWENNCWSRCLSMNNAHVGASSFTYNDQLFVIGGEHGKTIETLDFNEFPWEWVKFPGEFPYNVCYHKTVVYQNCIIHIGGYNYDIGETCNLISKLLLTSSCTLKELCKMLGPRDCHGVGTTKSKVLILGGEDHDANALDSVFEFDPKKKECKKMPSLPYPLTRMATVCWRDQVVVLGGCDKDGHVRNDVFMYDCNTGKITVLPSMLEKRCDFCSVITRNTIVVMGGKNDDEYFNSVECFTMGGYAWECLPAMNAYRCKAVADILLSER